MVTAGNLIPQLQYTEKTTKSHIFYNWQWLVIKHNVLGSFCYFYHPWVFSIHFLLLSRVCKVCCCCFLLNSALCWFFKYFIKLLALKELLFFSLQTALLLSSSLMLKYLQTADTALLPPTCSINNYRKVVSGVVYRCSFMSMSRNTWAQYQT